MDERSRMESLHVRSCREGEGSDQERTTGDHTCTGGIRTPDPTAPARMQTHANS